MENVQRTPNCEERDRERERRMQENYCNKIFDGEKWKSFFVLLLLLLLFWLLVANKQECHVFVSHGIFRMRRTFRIIPRIYMIQVKQHTTFTLIRFSIKSQLINSVQFAKIQRIRHDIFSFDGCFIRLEKFKYTKKTKRNASKQQCVCGDGDSAKMCSLLELFSSINYFDTVNYT